MIIYYPHINWKLENGKKNNSAKRANSILKIQCDKCDKIFIEKESVFNKRIKLIHKEYCGKCSRHLMCILAALKGIYDDNGNLKKNSGRYTVKSWDDMSNEEYEKKKIHNKNISIEFHNKLNIDANKKTDHYKKVFKYSTIGYISKAQNEIYEILKNYGYEIDGYVSGIRVDIINFDKKIAIEYNGDFWHCNPKFWKKDDYNKTINMTAGEKWINDRKRRFFLRKNGFYVNTIWEYDWTKNRNKVYELLNKITDKNFKFEKWEYKKAKPLKGRAFEDIYGEEKAKILKRNMSIRRTGKKLNKKYIIEVVTPNQGNFYINRLLDWHKVVLNSHSKLIKYNRILNSEDYEMWKGEVVKISLDVKCPHCGLFGSSGNMGRYHFENCKNKIVILK